MEATKGWCRMVNREDIGKVIVGMPKKAPGVAGGVLRRVLDIAIDGTNGLPGARQAAVSALGRKGDQQAAIDQLVIAHLGLAGAQGFVTNLGGLATMAVGVPANMVGVTIVQSRLVAGVAHLRGYDLDDNRVRSAVLMVLLGKEKAEQLVAKGDLASTPLAIATAPVFDATLDARIAERVVAAMLAQVGGKKVGLLFGRRIPLIGGGIGAVADGWSTRGIAVYAQEQFVQRRSLSR